MGYKGRKWCNNGTEQGMKFDLPAGWVWGRLDNKGKRFYFGEPWNKGKVGVQEAWNKGIIGVSEETSEKMSESAKARGMDRIDNTGKEPWNKCKEGYERFLNDVRTITDEHYQNHFEKINPNNYKRGLKEYHIDHIVSIADAFELGWSVEETAAVENLQMLYWKENLSKGRKSWK